MSISRLMSVQVTACFAEIMPALGPSVTRSLVCHHFLFSCAHLLEYIVSVVRGEVLGVRLRFLVTVTVGVAAAADVGTTALSSSIAAWDVAVDDCELCEIPLLLPTISGLRAAPLSATCIPCLSRLATNSSLPVPSSYECKYSTFKQ